MQCPECMAVNRAKANFCDNCGYSLHPSKKEEILPTSDITLDGERKHVTVLFSDLTGYTEMSEKLDPEEVKTITTLLFDEITKVIARYDGQVSKYIGDAVMAVFGAKQAREDDPVRAIKAASEIHKLVESYSSTYESNIVHNLSMHSGINSGLVVTGETKLEKGFHGFVGDTINLASRLSNLANVNEILVGPKTFSQAKGQFDFEPLKATKIKGKEKPVPIYRLVAVKTHPEEMKGIETRLIGRDNELRYLQETFRKTMEDRKTSIITVVGEAGIGKSRLLYEFAKWLDSVPGECFVFRGRGTPENRKSTNGLWKNLFSHQFGIEVRDGPDEVIAKFRRNLGEILEDGKADLMGHFVGFDFSSSLAVKNLLGSQAFEAMAIASLSNYVRSFTRGETVLLLDDIHFADAGSLDTLEQIIKSLPAAPLMIVCTARPILYEYRSEWGQNLNGHGVLQLKSFSNQDSEVFVKEIFKLGSPIPERLINLIVDRAEGNPFYIEELVKMLVEEGVITGNSEQWDISLDDLIKLKIPTSLNGILQARLDALPEMQKRFLQRASVMGRLFWDQGALCLMTEEEDRLSQPELDTILEDSVDRQLILKREKSQIENSREFLFKHALLRDVAYETLLLKRRRIYHSQAAEWLIEKAGQRLDEYLHIIGGHYELAGEKLKAVHYLERAGKSFHKINAYQESVSALERCQKLLSGEDQTKWAEIEVQLGEINTDKGEYSRAKTHFQDALKNDRLLSSQDIVVSSFRLGWIFSKMGEYDKGIEYVDRGLEIARKHNDTHGTVQCLHTKGWIYFLVGKFDDAILCAQEALGISKKNNDKRSISLCLNVIQAAANGLENFNEALKINEKCICIGRELGDQLIISRGLCNQGEHFRKQHKYKKSLNCYEESLEISREIDQKNLICITLYNRGFALNQLGRLNEAQKCGHESLSLALEIEAYALALHSVVVMAEVYSLSNQLEKAAELIGMVCAHPMYTHEHSYESDRVMSNLHNELPESVLHAAFSRGKKLQTDKIFNSILSTGNQR